MDILKREFTAQDGSFLIQLRPNLIWDKEAFSTLAAAMETCCKQCEQQETLDRWMVEGFWYMSWFVREWTSHPNFPRPLPLQYYEQSLRRLEALSYWYFSGCSPYQGDDSRKFGDFGM
ncbi:MAG: hypothetical protein WCL32_09110 [Planctomycetota bacterium]